MRKTMVNRILGVGYGILFFLAALSPLRIVAADPASQAPGQAPWFMAGANPRRTSWVAEEVRGTLKPLWLKPFEPYISMKVQVVAADGAIFISTSRGLYAIDAETGAEKWVYPTEMPLGHSPAAVDGVVYFGCFDRRIHAVDAGTGQRIWASEPAGAGFHTSPLVVDPAAGSTGSTQAGSGQADLRVYAGNRDGVFYCLDARSGAVAWTYATETQQPILFSASYAEGVVYFAANDMRAYALDAKTGALKWKSEKLPGVGFHSWWPVIAGDLLVLPGSTPYRTQAHNGPGPLAPDGSADLQRLDGIAVYPEYWIEDPKAPPPKYVGEVKDGYVDMGRVLEYHAAKPWRRTMFVLDRATGREKTYDFGEPGKQCYIPALWWGTHGGNRSPPMAAPDGSLYFPQSFRGNKYIQGGQIFGWKPGERRLKIISSSPGLACDEPVICAGGGNLVYWILCAVRSAGAIDFTIQCERKWELETEESPRSGLDASREWQYFGYNIGKTLNFPNPGGPPQGRMSWSFQGAHNRQSQVGMFGGDKGGGYGLYGDFNPPIPYKGKVYFIVGGNINALSAWAPEVKEPVKHLAMSEIVDAPSEAPVKTIPPQDQDPLRKRLASEIEKMLAAGLLRPGWFSSGIYDFQANWGFRSPYGVAYLVDYWHDPVDTICALARAMPLLPDDMRERVKAYIRELVQTYPPWEYSHLGWKDGAAREVYSLPPDVESEFDTHDAAFYSQGRKSARLFYGLWKYAKLFDNANNLFDDAREHLAAHKYLMDKPIPEDILRNQAFLLNACIANRIGYLELERMAGEPESQDVRLDLERLIEMRFETLTKEMVIFPTQTKSDHYERQVNLFRNFLHMVPELAERIGTHNPPEFDEDELDDLALEFEVDITAAEAKGDHQEADRIRAEQALVVERYRGSRVPALDKVRDIVETHRLLAPYWFVVKAEESIQEGNHRPYQDRYGIFQAMAQILGAPRAELEKFLDVPACPVGDLYFIENLCAAIEAGE